MAENDTELDKPGNCLKCDFFKESRCMKAENILSQVTDPICLSKIQIMLLRDIAVMFEEYLLGEEE